MTHQRRRTETALPGTLTTRAPAAAPAGVTRRLLCVFYEFLLLTAVVFTATVILLAASHLAGLTLPRTVLQVYVVVVSACYFVPQWRAGQTLPMKTWRMRIVDHAGRPLTAQRALMRYGFALLTVLTVGAGFLWAYIDRDRQFLHDRLSGTRVIRDNL